MLANPGQILCLALTLAAIPASALDRVEIRIADSSRAYLESDPYDAEKVPATWIAGTDTFSASVSYRGAYSLQGLLKDPTGPRNWKLKTAKATPYRSLREWNFNLETHLRQKMSLDLYAAADVPAMPARHVVLHVNGKRQGTYIEFPDPDNKPWLAATFGSDSGDLYKGATDIPGQPAFFGELTDLGDHDSGYWGHYQKKTNDAGLDSLNYRRLREFIVWVNRSSDAEFETGLPRRLDLGRFLRYLVVANFTGHWDGYPNRGKNYWLYWNPADGRWNVLPWDVDGTFQSDPWCLNNMGPKAGLFFMEWPEKYCPNSRETRSRPLLERVMKVPAWKRMYIGEYQKALRTYLAEAPMLARLDSLDALVKPDLTTSERTAFAQARTDMRNFIAVRTDHVASLLAAYPAYDPTPAGVTRRAAPVVAPPEGPWMDVRGRKLSGLDGAPAGVWRRGVEVRAIVR